MSLRINGPRLWQTLMELGKIGGTPQGGVSRIALSDEDRQARELLQQWAEEAVDETHIDEVGYLFLIRHGENRNTPLLLTGSHLDTHAGSRRFKKGSSLRMTFVINYFSNFYYVHIFTYRIFRCMRHLNGVYTQRYNIAIYFARYLRTANH